MPTGSHVARCLACGKQWMVGDCIPSFCSDECREEFRRRTGLSLGNDGFWRDHTGAVVIQKTQNEEIRRERDDVSSEDLEKAERQIFHHDKCAASLSALVEENGVAAVLSILGTICHSRQESMPTHWALTRHAWSVVRKRLADLAVYANENC